jgi:DNA-binding MarR family transcriptional regulator
MDTMRPVRGPAKSVSFLIARIGFESGRRLKERLEPFGIEPRQFALLNQVELREGMSQQAIADSIGIPKSRMVAIVDALEKRDLVERRRGDRRTHAIYLTDRGNELLRQTRRAAMEHDADLTGGLSTKEREQLVTLLRKLADGL